MAASFIGLLLCFAPATAQLAAQNVEFSNLSTPVTPVTPPITPPIEHALPIIDTDSLPTGQVNVEYRTKILAHDNNPEDKLVTSVTDLPQNLTMNSNGCEIKISERGIQRSICKVKGTPLKNGNYNVTVTVCNDLGCTSKTLKLAISQ